MLQGDAYNIPFVIKQGDTVVTDTMVSAVEIVIGPLKKTHPDGGLTYSGGEWLFALTQAETFALSAASQPAQVRVKFTGGDVVGASLGGISVARSLSKAVL